MYVCVNMYRSIVKFSRCSLYKIGNIHGLLDFLCMDSSHLIGNWKNGNYYRLKKIELLCNIMWLVMVQCVQS